MSSKDMLSGISNNTKRTLNKLYEKLRPSKVTTGITNLVSMNPSGKYNINSSTLEEIIPLISRVCSEVSPSLAEIPRDVSYLKFDVDMDSSKKPKKRLYKKDQVIEFINIVRNSCNKFLKLDKNDMICYVMEKKGPDNRDDKYRDGFHIAFPYIIQSSKIRNAILEDIYSEAEKCDLFNCKKNGWTIKKVIDRKASVGKTPWMMLGCAKPGCSPYNITMVLNNKNKKVKFTQNMEVVELLSMLNEDLTIDNCSHLKDGISIDIIEKRYQEVSHQLQQALALPNTDANVETARILVRMLSKERASNYEDWIRTGYCLYNISRILLPEWITFSKMCSSKFKKGECEKLWRGMKSGSNMLTIRSLHRWAKEDNYLEYKEFKSREYNSLFANSLTGDHQSVGNAIFSKYHTDFICAGIKNRTWYQYNYATHSWENIEDGHTLKSKITDEFTSEYVSMNQDLYHKVSQCDPSDKVDLMKRIQKIHDLINKLSNESFLSTLVDKTCARKFYVKDFMEDLDENYDLIGFNNGVFDLKKGLFRDGQPEDFITMSTRLDYQPLDRDSQEFKDCMKLMEDIHPDKKTREYVLTLFSTFVAGHHKEEKLHLFNGCGSNGKSVTFELLKNCFGDYFMSVPVTLMTRKRGATESASPMMAQLKGKRLGVLQEPEEGEKLSVGLMKELTGNDEVTARPLFMDPITFKPQIKFAIPCNNLPEVPARDKGTWRRLRVINHEMEFVDKPNPKIKTQKKIDRSLKDKLEGFAPQFMAFLIDRYINVYLKNGMPSAPSVDYATNMYNQENNCIKQFCENKFEVTGKKTDRISIRTVWDEFKSYHKEEHEGTKRPLQKELYAFLTSEYGAPTGGRGGKSYSGIIFAGDDEIDENVDL